MLKLLIYDLDGTLADTTIDLHQSMNDALAHHGIPPCSMEEVLKSIGHGARQLVQGCLAAKGAKQDEVTQKAVLGTFLDFYKDHCTDSTTAYPGVADLLPLLSQQYAQAVLTNKPQSASDLIVDHLGLRPFLAAVIGGDGPYGRKPDPGGLEQILQKLGCSPAECVLIGDGIPDIQVAKAAGVHFVAYLSGIGSPDEMRANNPAHILYHFSGLPDILARIESGHWKENSV